MELSLISVCLVVILQLLSCSRTEGLSSCKDIKDSYPDAVSGVYTISADNAPNQIEAYCEMGIDKGGYTFLNSGQLQFLTNDDLQSMFTDKSSFLMRLKKCDNHQPYIVLKQLAQYSGIPLMLGLNHYTDYNKPINADLLGGPYLYFGFLNAAQSKSYNVQGLSANGKDYAYTTCGHNGDNHFALFTNNKESPPTDIHLGVPFPLVDQVLGSAINNPSKRAMGEDYFYFMETHFADCGWYTQTDSRLDSHCIISAAIGFR